MPSSIDFTSHDELILEAYDQAFDPDPSLSPTINGLSKGEKEEFFEWCRECVSVSFNDFKSYPFYRQNETYLLYLSTLLVDSILEEFPLK